VAGGDGGGDGGGGDGGGAGGGQGGGRGAIPGGHGGGDGGGGDGGGDGGSGGDNGGGNGGGGADTCMKVSVGFSMLSTVTFNAAVRESIVDAERRARTEDANDSFVVLSVDTTRTLAAVALTTICSSSAPTSVAKLLRKSLSGKSSTVPATVTMNST